MKILSILPGKQARWFAVLSLISISCLDQKTSEPELKGFVSLYNAAPDAPTLDISLDGQRINNVPFQYGDFSGYLGFSVGQRTVTMRSTAGGTDLINTSFDVVAGKTYSLFVVNKMPTLQALFIEDVAPTVPVGAMVRFIHLSPDAESVDVVLKDVNGGEKTISSGSIFQNSSMFTEVDPSSYKVNVTASSDDGINILSDNILLRPGNYYTIILQGLKAPPQGNSHSLTIKVF